MPLRILAILTVLTLVLTSWVGTAEAVDNYYVAQKAKEYAAQGSTRWTFEAYHPYGGRNTDKCNLFVADVLEEMGKKVPHRWWGMAGPIGAGEWGNPHSSYLTSAWCWKNTLTPNEGNVVGDGRHVGIMTGLRQTTSAGANGLVTNDWGFRAFGPGSRDSVTFWASVCSF
ncbi:uncharacterized protein [Asterias amurensis]|uniref:uncharacterized protein n=1 Tax=Asterias amurensis TaxID=7602 RepID=UPI003AB33568